MNTTQDQTPTAQAAGSKLERCPFCGCNAPHPALRRGFPVEVWCPNCGARGPERLTGREADEAWNVRRTQTVDPKLQADNAKLRKALVGLVGADTKAELEEMEAAIRLLAAPDEDRMNTINAIHALRDTSSNSGYPTPDRVTHAP